MVRGRRDARARRAAASGVLPPARRCRAGNRLPTSSKRSTRFWSLWRCPACDDDEHRGGDRRRAIWSICGNAHASAGTSHRHHSPAGAAAGPVPSPASASAGPLQQRATRDRRWMSGGQARESLDMSAELRGDAPASDESPRVAAPILSAAAGRCADHRAGAQHRAVSRHGVSRSPSAGRNRSPPRSRPCATRSRSASCCSAIPRSPIQHRSTCIVSVRSRISRAMSPRRTARIISSARASSASRSWNS